MITGIVVMTPNTIITIANVLSATRTLTLSACQTDNANPKNIATNVPKNTGTASVNMNNAPPNAPITRISHLNLIYTLRRTLPRAGTFCIAIVAIAQMTPGPVGLNAATYIGYQQGVKALGDLLGVYPAGCLGALSGTLGVVTPSLTLVLSAAVFLAAFQENRYVKSVLGGIRPAMLGLIGAAVIFFANTSVFTAPLSVLFREPGSFGISWKALLIFITVLIVEFKYKPNILYVIGGSVLAAWILQI